MSRRILVGVVGVIAPFNGPVILGIRAIAPALALGNAVICKPDPRTAVCGGVVFARVFEEAGLPDGLFHVLPGGTDVGEAVVSDPLIPVIAFTGSTRAGKAIARAAADRLKRVHRELGGNSSLIVLNDADLGRAVSIGAMGSFRHAGQICMATSRHLVAESIADDYTAALAEHAEKIVVGDPARDGTVMGPVIDAKQRDNIHRIVTSSVDAGAKLAPVVPFSTPEEAVELAADTEYGLSPGILTQDVMKGLSLAERIPAGLVHINDQTINDEAVIPFGGVGQSGNGSRVGGAQANLEAFTEVQWVTIRGELPQYPL